MTHETSQGTESHLGIDLSAEHLRTVRDIVRSHLPGVSVWAYGSRVNGNARRYSDIDLVVFASPEQGPQLNDLREAFDESDLPLWVDLSSWTDIPDSFSQQIRNKYAVLQSGATDTALRETDEPG